MKVRSFNYDILLLFSITSQAQFSNIVHNIFCQDVNRVSKRKLFAEPLRVSVKDRHSGSVKRTAQEALEMIPVQD